MKNLVWYVCTTFTIKVSVRNSLQNVKINVINMVISYILY